MPAAMRFKALCIAGALVLFVVYGYAQCRDASEHAVVQ